MRILKKKITHYYECLIKNLKMKIENCKYGNKLIKKGKCILLKLIAVSMDLSKSTNFYVI